LRIIFLILIFFNTLFSAEIKEEAYLGSNYNLFLALEPSCLSLIGNTDVLNEHTALVGKLTFCDAYINDSQDYLEEVYNISTGVILYTNNVYRDSFFTSFMLGMSKSFITDIFNEQKGNNLSMSGIISLGYQWHFKRGYTISLAAYASYDKILIYEDKSDARLKSELSKDTTRVGPSLLLGWRF